MTKERPEKSLYDELVAFVSENYAHKIVEVGVGHRAEVAERLKERLPSAEILVTDSQEVMIDLHRARKFRAIVDDVLSPNLQEYHGASLIYSINPPIELMPALERLAEKLGSDLLVKPVSDEQDRFYDTKWERVVRNGHPLGWILRSPRHPSPHQQ